jgi:CubicO group peptidase (beta-lactamase class C family)
VLGLLVETLSGQPLDVFVRDHITGPLGMHDTAFFTPPEKAGRMATCYRVASAPDKPVELKTGHAQVISSCIHPRA